MSGRIIPELFFCSLLSFSGFVSLNLTAQPDCQPLFDMPDTVCQGEPVQFVNTLPGNTFFWNFSSGNASYIPKGVSIGDPGGFLSGPNYIYTIPDGDIYYSFVPSPGLGSLIRLRHGSSLFGYIEETTNLGSFGILNNGVKGVFAGKDGINWYVFVLCGNKILRLDFGTTLENTPQSQVFSFTEFSAAEKMLAVPENGEWIGFLTDITDSDLWRLRFGTSLANTPVIEPVGLSQSLFGPAGFDLRRDSSFWYMLVCNSGNGSLSRLLFSDGLLNPPVMDYLFGHFIQNKDVSIIQDCEHTDAYITNYVLQGVFMVHLSFPFGLGGVTTSDTITGIPAVLNRPYGLSGIFREDDLLCMLVVNNGSSQISRYVFKVDDASAIGTFSGPYPPPVVYPEAGNYNVVLRVDAGTANEQVYCQNLVVIPAPVISLGPDRDVCLGDTLVLDPGGGFKSYLWSTGDTTPFIRVADSGLYIVEVTNEGNCIRTDSVTIGIHDTSFRVSDTTICRGERFWAQNDWQTEAGTYVDVFPDKAGCDSTVVTNLVVEICSLRIWVPNAFTPNGDGLNDTFHPVVENANQYRLLIFDRWGAQLFETTDTENGWDGTFRGEGCSAGTYSYLIQYETYESPGVTEKQGGTFTLIR